MRCSDVIDQLRTSSSGFDLDPAVSDHLASCSECAGWAEDDVRLLRCWQATRPAEPSAEVWNALWARVSDGLEAAHAERPRVLTMPEQPAAARRFRPGLVAFGLAQAAAILLAVWLLPGRHPHPRSGEPTAPLAQAILVVGKQVEFDSGRVGLLSEDKGKWYKVVDSARTGEDADQLDGNYDLFNVVEAMADVEGADETQ
jgi:hypothetical protein